MINDLNKQIYNELNLKETNELTEIWQTNNRVEWSKAAFDAIQMILLERLGELPAQKEPVWEQDGEGSSGLDEVTLGKFAGMQNGPVFYKPKDVLWLETWLNRAAYAAIGLTILAGLLGLGPMQKIILSFFSGNAEWNLIAWFIALIIFPFTVALQIGIFFLGFKALGTILKILMEIEFNSRSV